jgi:hypothetical protein
MKRFVVAATLAATLATPVAAHAFCGFYVGGADAELFNNATQVVLMREGTRTVLSMQNNYQGPPRTSRWWCRCRWCCTRRTSRRCRPRSSPRSIS